MSCIPRAFDPKEKVRSKLIGLFYPAPTCYPQENFIKQHVWNTNNKNDKPLRGVPLRSH
jgi:hypothetical protein